MKRLTKTTLGSEELKFEQIQKDVENVLAQGYCLTIVKGTDQEISQTESILKNTNIQDWMIFNTL